MVPWTHLVCPPNWLTIGWAASAQDTIECTTCIATGRIYAMNAIRLKELFISSPSSYQQCHHSKNNKMAHAKQKLHRNCQFVREICFTPGENTVLWKYQYQHRTPVMKEAMTFPSREWVVDEKKTWGETTGQVLCFMLPSLFWHYFSWDIQPIRIYFHLCPKALIRNKKEEKNPHLVHLQNWQ